jgi:ABC-type Fe3+-hydroxamate transport system substrate-binding protein
MAEHAGAVNALGETLGPFPPISREIIVATDPEVIIDTVFEYTGATPDLIERERRLYRESLPTVDAVRSDRVIFWDDPHLTIPGPGMAEEVEKLARAIHPEAFDD